MSPMPTDLVSTGALPAASAEHVRADLAVAERREETKDGVPNPPSDAQDDKTYRTSSFTISQEAEIKRLWEEETDVSAKAIATRFGTTRNVVIGLARRRNWKSRLSVSNSCKNAKYAQSVVDRREEREFVPERMKKSQWRELVSSIPDPGPTFTRTLFTRLDALHAKFDALKADLSTEGLYVGS